MQGTSTVSIPTVGTPTQHQTDRRCEWAPNATAQLLFDHKEPPIFHSLRWKTHTSPDLAFAVCRHGDPIPERRVTNRLPQSHDRPSVIKAPSLVNLTGGNLSQGGTSRRPTGRPSLWKQTDYQAAYQIQASLMWTQHMQPSSKCS